MTNLENGGCTFVNDDLINLPSIYSTTHLCDYLLDVNVARGLFLLVDLLHCWQMSWWQLLFLCAMAPSNLFDGVIHYSW
jgi:hypothetical protein